MSDGEGCFVAKGMPYIEPENSTPVVKSTEPPRQYEPMFDPVLITFTCRRDGSEVLRANVHTQRPKGTRIILSSDMTCLGLEYHNLQAALKHQDGLLSTCITLSSAISIRYWENCD
jgi:hypothetical protein